MIQIKVDGFISWQPTTAAANLLWLGSGVPGSLPPAAPFVPLPSQSHGTFCSCSGYRGGERLI